MSDQIRNRSQYVHGCLKVAGVGFELGIQSRIAQNSSCLIAIFFPKLVEQACYLELVKDMLTHSDQHQLALVNFQVCGVTREHPLEGASNIIPTAQAQALNHPMSLDYTLIIFIPALLINGYGVENELQLPKVPVHLVSEKDLAFFNHFKEVLWGYIQVKQGETEQGIAHMKRSISDLQMSGIQIGRRLLLYLLAIANQKADQPEQELAIIGDVLSLLEKSKNHLFLAGCYQLKGELHFSEHQATTSTHHSIEESSLLCIQEAGKCFLMAIEVAQRQKAKSWELKAAISLARLW